MRTDWNQARTQRTRAAMFCFIILFKPNTSTLQHLVSREASRNSDWSAHVDKAGFAKEHTHTQNTSKHYTNCTRICTPCSLDLTTNYLQRMGRFSFRHKNDGAGHGASRSTFDDEFRRTKTGLGCIQFCSTLYLGCMIHP